MTLLAYPNGQPQKDAIVAELQAHADADRLVKGQYWENGKGCAVGCTIQSGHHGEYETRFGIPEALARFEDTIFENLPNENAMRWPMRFMLAPKPGADLSLVQWQFLAFVVREALDRPEAESVREACQPALDILEAAARGEPIDKSAAANAVSAANAAAANAANAAAWSAASAANAAAVSAAAWSAASAANAAAVSAANAAAANAAAANAANAEAWNSAWIRYSEKLLELMSAAVVPE